MYVYVMGLLDKTTPVTMKRKITPENEDEKGYFRLNRLLFLLFFTMFLKN